MIGLQTKDISKYKLCVNGPDSFNKFWCKGKKSTSFWC